MSKNLMTCLIPKLNASVIIMKEKYKIDFEKVANVNGRISFYADSHMTENPELARHLTCSGKEITEMQIDDLEIALRGLPIQEDWGEVGGSLLYIHQSEGNVEVGYSNKKIPIQDFKQLLEEWLLFIS